MNCLAGWKLNNHLKLSSVLSNEFTRIYTLVSRQKSQSISCLANTLNKMYKSKKNDYNKVLKYVKHVKEYRIVCTRGVVPRL